MKKVFLLIIPIVVIAIFAAIGGFMFWSQGNKSSTPVDYKNATYIIEGSVIKLSNGFAQTETAPGSASKTTTQIFGNESYGVLNDDNLEDMAVILTQTNEGSGTFYYIAASIRNAFGTYTGTNGILLGDRIAPQNTQIKDKQIIVNYADRNPGEPMTTQPSMGISRVFEVKGDMLVEAAKPISHFGNPTTLSIASEAVFDDGLRVKLSAINDSRCKQGVVCVWAGELAAQLNISGGKLASPDEVNLGFERQKETIKNGYVFTLDTITETTATIKVTLGAQAMGNCYIGGCSSEICSDQPNAVSTCIWSESFACYKTAKCERQQNGKCGWTQTSVLTSCLNSSN